MEDSPIGLFGLTGYERSQRTEYSQEKRIPRSCKLTGTAVQTGNLVSHSNHKTRTRFLPNLCNVTLISDVLQRKIRMRVSASALSTVEHRGGPDDLWLKTSDSGLSRAALAIKRAVAKKLAAGG